jgi:hypothetical protein
MRWTGGAWREAEGDDIEVSQCLRANIMCVCGVGLVLMVVLIMLLVFLGG